jgi:hypothetical protein
MAIYRYPDEVAKFISKNVDGRTVRELVQLTNAKFGTSFTESSMKAYKHNHKLKSGTRCGLPPGYSKLYPYEIQEFIENNVSGRQITDLTELINSKFKTEYKPTQIRAYVKNHGLVSGVDCRIQKGNIPINKGKKKWWVGGEETQFKHGHKPHNHMPVGSEVVKADGYLWVKIAEPNKWRQKHILLWEEHNGSVPEGYVLIFGDGDQMNVELDNLVMVSRSQLAVLNHFDLIQRDVELTKAALVVADIKSKISQKQKKFKATKKQVKRVKGVNICKD